MKTSCVVLVLLLPALLEAVNIDSFGAIANDTSLKAALNNGIAFYKAILAANSSSTDRTVVVSAGKNYTIAPAVATISYLTDLTIQLDGIFNALPISLEQNDWPLDAKGNAISLITFDNCQRLIFKGTGIVEGNGYFWWWTVIITGKDNRPNMFEIATSKDTLIEGVTFRNAPQYHMTFRDALNMTVRNLVVFVEADDKDGDLKLPTFPLNTDGIDISGKDIYFTNLTFQNFDDAVAVKPTHHNQGKYSNCTENILIENSYVKYGVGMSIGSVPPNVDLACIRNITIRNIRFDKPFKAIYIKPNPAKDGLGIIDQITYENIQIYDALWWAIFIGTQQQHQPAREGTGCSFFYPLPGQDCPTDPLVTIQNITLRNVDIYGGVLSPGIMICNATNPCTNLIFDNVNVYNRSLFPVEKGYLCENFSGYARNSNLVPDCLTKLD